MAKTKTKTANRPPVIDLRAWAKYRAWMDGNDDPDDDGDDDSDLPDGFTVLDEDDEGVQDIYCYCPIGDYKDYDWSTGEVKQNGLTAGAFAKEWREIQASGAKRIRMFFNSPGGDVFDGAAIYNLIARSKLPVDGYVDGTALSITSMIAMACDKLYMAETSWLMMHNPWACTVGNVKDHEATIGTLNTLKGGMAAAYIRKSGMKAAEVDSIMDSETWLTAQEAKDKGLCDEIVGSKDVQAHCDFKRFAAIYQRTPSGIQQFYNAATNVRAPRTQPTPDNGDKKEFQAMADKPVITVDTLRTEYPEVFAAVQASGVKQGAESERQRVSAIYEGMIDDSQETLAKKFIADGTPAIDAVLGLTKAYKAGNTTELDRLHKETSETALGVNSPAPKAAADKDVSEAEVIKRWTDRFIAEGRDPQTAERMARRAAKS